MTGSMSLWLSVAFTAVAMTLVVAVLGLLWDRRIRERVRREMLERIGPAEDPGDAPTALELFRDTPGASRGLMDALAAMLPRSGDMDRLIRQSGLTWSAGRFVLLSVLSTLALGTAAYLFAGSLVAAAPLAALGATLPWLYARRCKARRVAAFEELFPDAIDLLGRAIRAGHAFSTALKMVADEMGDPLGPEFRRVFEEQKFGLPLDESLSELAERIDLADVRIFNTGVLIPRRVGGNLAEILDNLARTIRERFTIQRQVRVYTAQGRFTGYLLGVLPVVIGFLLYLLNRDYMSILWTENIGRVLIVTALLFQIVGFFVIRRIVDIEV
ncbi:MAG TPA: type II secretion system F family protein [Gemmatimonadota bacterium]|jgi:tight adherence protein B